MLKPSTRPWVRLLYHGTSGSLPFGEQQTSSIEVRSGDSRLLFDMGTGFLLNYPPNENPFADFSREGRAIFCSHLHPDHWVDSAQYAVGAACGALRGLVREHERSYGQTLIVGPKGIRDTTFRWINAAGPNDGLMSEEIFDKVFRFHELDPEDPSSLNIEVGDFRVRAQPVGHLGMSAYSYVAKIGDPETDDETTIVYTGDFNLQRPGAEPPAPATLVGQRLTKAQLNDHMRARSEQRRYRRRVRQYRRQQAQYRALIKDADVIIADAAGATVHPLPEDIAALTAEQAEADSEARERVGRTRRRPPLIVGTHILPTGPIPGYIRSRLRQNYHGPVDLAISGTYQDFNVDRGPSSVRWTDTGELVSHLSVTAFDTGRRPRLMRGATTNSRRFDIPGVLIEDEGAITELRNKSRHLRQARRKGGAGHEPTVGRLAWRRRRGGLD